MTAHPATDLLSLCGRYLSLERRQNLLFDAQMTANEAGNKALDDHLFAVQQRFAPYSKELAAEIFERTAQTPAELRAKAAVAATYVTTWADGSPCCDDMPLWSLCRDLMAERAQS